MLTVPSCSDRGWDKKWWPESDGTAVVPRQETWCWRFPAVVAGAGTRIGVRSLVGWLWCHEWRADDGGSRLLWLRLNKKLVGGA
jgi:hypothetical protein